MEVRLTVYETISSYWKSWTTYVLIGYTQEMANISGFFNSWAWALPVFWFRLVNVVLSLQSKEHNAWQNISELGDTAQQFKDYKDRMKTAKVTLNRRYLWVNIPKSVPKHVAKKPNKE